MRLGLALCALLIGANAAWGQMPDTTGESAQADARLAKLQRQIEAVEIEVREARKKALSIADEMAELRKRLVNAAKAAQDTEDQLNRLEFDLKKLAEEEVLKSQTLERRSAQMNGVLSALQRLAWRPTEALIAQPQSPADTVRSAILLRKAVPELERSLALLKADIASVSVLRQDILEKRKSISLAHTRWNQEHQNLKALWDRKSQIQSESLAQQAEVLARQQALVNEVEDLRELLARLELQRLERIAEAKRKAEAERIAREREAEARRQQLAAEKAAREAEKAAKLAAERAAKAEAERERERQRQEARRAAILQRQAEEEAKNRELMALEATKAAEKAAREAKASSQPQTEMPIQKAKGKLTMPARGKLVTRFGQINSLGTESKGVVYATRPAAQIVAPHEGQVAFAGPFRGYGLLLIIEHGEGYHTLLAGMATISAQVGQRLLAGEPVATMSETEPNPELYIELRQDGHPVDPLLWLNLKMNKVSG